MGLFEQRLKTRQLAKLTHERINSQVQFEPLGGIELFEGVYSEIIFTQTKMNYSDG